MKKFIILFVVLCFSHSAFAADYTQGELSNNLHYIIYKTAQLPIVSVNIKIKAGSYFDRIGKFGESYITAKALSECSTKHLSSDALKQKIDALGIEISTSSNKEFININAKSLSCNAEKMFYIISEMLHSKFDEKNLNFVKRDAINLIKSLQNDKDYLALHSSFTNLISQPEYYHTSVGLIKDIKKISKRDIESFYNRYFNAENMVVSVSGNGFKEKDIKHLLSRYFSFIKKGKVYNFKKLEFKKGKFFEDRVKKVQQSYIYISYPSFGVNDKRHYAADVLAFILGGNLNSVLSKNVRTKHGYAYSVFSFNYKLSRGGLFVVGLQTQNKFTVDAIKEVFFDIKNIKKYLTKDRIKGAKTYLIGSKTISLQSSLNIANSFSSIYMMNINSIPWKYYKREIENVSRKDVLLVADKIFKSGISIGVVSDKNYKLRLKDILEK